MKIIVLFAWFGFLAVADTSLKEPQVSIDELKVMADQKKWTELLQVGTAMLPGQRNAQWSELIEKASIEYVKEKQNQKASRIEKYIDPLVQDYPDLLRSAKFMEVRRVAGVESFRECFRGEYDESDCVGLYLRYSNAERTSLSTIKEAASLVAANSPADAIRFWDLYYEYGSASQICGDLEFQKAWVSALGAPKGPALKVATKMAQGPCWSAVQPQVEKALAETDKAKMLLKNLCPLEKKIRGLASTITTRCH